MTRPDDSTLTPQQYVRIRQEAQRILKEADALGRFPTPVADIVAVARVTVDSDNIFDEQFLALMRKKAGPALKRALSKVIGLLDAKGRRIFIDTTVYDAKKTFVKLHETGHAVLPWQCNLYSAIEDCDKTLSHEISDLFDREANVFASEVLFQLDRFTEEAADYDFGILTPVKLSAKYGASIYSAVRRYVATHPWPCTVLVLNLPEPTTGKGLVATLRRVVNSPRFETLFGSIPWPEQFTLNDPIGAMIPLGGKRMSGKRNIQLVDRNGDPHECIAEAFTQMHQVFILIHANPLTTSTGMFVPEEGFL